MNERIAHLISRTFRSVALMSFVAPLLIAQQTPVPSPDGHSEDVPHYTLTTKVNLVVLDVVVTDAHGAPVHGLTRDDFKVVEDGVPQRVLSFDTANFDGAMEYTPAQLPQLPRNTFVDLPQSPERGPLYVLLYDLVNIPNEDQVFARKQLVKFIENAPAGARFALFVSSDGVHLVQGFTSNRQELYAAIDPKSSKPHVPEIFLMGTNFGQNDPLAAASRLSAIAGYLAPLPGRKNLIWIASMFPLDLFPSITDTEQYRDAAKKTLDLLAANQIAVYPVDVSGVVLSEVYSPPGAAPGSTGIATDARENGIGDTTGPAGGSTAVPAGGGHASSFQGGPGVSQTESNYMMQDEIARVTGGKALYSSNAVSQSLDKVIEDGGSYYTLTYSPTNKSYNGKLRRIYVALNAKEDHLSYRRAYYGSDSTTNDGKVEAQQPIEESSGGLSAEMEHGAPSAHQLVFAAHVRTLGPAAMGTKEQMANIASQTTLMKAEHHSGSLKPAKAIQLQTYAIDYTVMAHQFQLMGEVAPDIEIAAALYDADGRLLNASVSNVQEDKTQASDKSAPKDAFRMEQRLDAPLAARYLRIAVRDTKTNKAGAMEVPLPLASE
jgi:VWFA-related protein